MDNQQQRFVPKATGSMKLTNVARGKQREPYRVLLAGVEGIGKTTFAAAAPSPIFIEPERGSGHLDVPRFPPPTNLPDVLEAVQELTVSEHAFQTVVIDTIDWLEPMVWAFVCSRDGKSDVEDYGYGKGYQVALDEWRKVLSALERLEKAKGMNVILLAHTQLRSFKNPEGDDFDRYELKLHAKAGGLVKEWVKAVLFTNYETYAVKAKNALKAKGVSSGARLIFTTRSAAYDAKNRYSLPPALPLSWPDFDTAAQLGQPMSGPELLEAIRQNAARVSDDVAKQVAGALERAAGDVGKLSELNNWVAAKIAMASNTNPSSTKKES